jgi:hypothetical protein
MFLQIIYLLGKKYVKGMGWKHHNDVQIVEAMAKKTCHILRFEQFEILGFLFD